jgi:AraC family transcriptional regulator of adaptative response/methylated-DNA-[protein]-cysteine methyltransferase
MSPRQFKKGGANLEICFAIENCQLGLVLVAATDRGVCAIELGSSPRVLRKELAAQFPNSSVREDKRAMENHLAALRQYFSNPAQGLSLPLDIVGTAFQQRVWQALRNIPVGQTATYGQIAQEVGAPKAVRAVGSACGANKVALAIPCHRVVRTGGSPGGYRWGIQRKCALLKAERAKAAASD